LLHTYTVSILLSVYFYFFLSLNPSFAISRIGMSGTMSFSCPEYSKTGSTAIHAKRVGIFESVLIIGTIMV
jgi:hypothetical protein